MLFCVTCFYISSHFQLCIFVPTALSIQWINARIQINYYEIQVTPQNNRSPHMQLKTLFLPFSLPQNEPQLSVLHSLVDYSWEHTDMLFSAYLVSLLMQSGDASPSIIAYLHSSSGKNSADWISLFLFPLWTRTCFSPSSSHFVGTLLIISKDLSHLQPTAPSLPFTQYLDYI